MTILVTGATGFIGAHLCRELVASGHKVIGLSHSGNTKLLGSLMANDNFVLATGDIRNKERTNELFAYCRVGTIFHLAALVPYLQGDDLLGINADGTRNLIHSAYANGVEDFIYASSMGVYSVPPEVLPVPENHPIKPDTEYGQSKLIGETYCEDMSKSMRTVIVRYAGAYGKGMEESRVIPLFIMQALKNEPLEVLGDGKQSSDFCYVEDIVRGTILAWQKGISGSAYNIGSGRETILSNLAMDILEITHSKSVINETGDKIERSFRFWLDITKARKELDYEPMPYIDGLRLYVNERNRGHV